MKKLIIWLTNVDIGTLIKVAAFGGIATATMGFKTRSKISDNVKGTEYYKEALATLRKHKGAVTILGEPIKDLTIDVGDTLKNYSKDDVAQYEVRVSGSKQKGVLYFWAEKNASQNKWTVSKIELELKNDPYKRLLIKQSINE